MTELTAAMRRTIKRKLSHEQPTVWIGKSGVSHGLVKEIEKQLEKREMIKVKILRSALEEEEAERIASRTAEQTQALLAEVRGHTFLLYKSRKK